MNEYFSEQNMNCKFISEKFVLVSHANTLNIRGTLDKVALIMNSDSSYIKEYEGRNSSWHPRQV